MWLWPLDDDWNAIELLSGDHAGCDEPDTPVVASVVPSGDQEGSEALAISCVPVLLRKIPVPRTKTMSPSAPLEVAPSAPPPSGSTTKTRQARTAVMRRQRRGTGTLYRLKRITA